MSNFYPLPGELRAKEVHKMHLMQANMTTTGKHTGSKSAKKLAYNAKKINRNISMIEAMLKRNV